MIAVGNTDKSTVMQGGILIINPQKQG